jgi:hypothetical protein
LASGRAWTAAAAASSRRATALAVAALTGRPSTGKSASPTLRVDSPSAKPARIMRSTSSTRRA